MWKKVGLKATTVDDIQDEAQEELEKEGAGMRKKLRMLTSRENINDAMWAEVMPDDCAKDKGSRVGNNGKNQSGTRLLVKLLTPSRSAFGEP